MPISSQGPKGQGSETIPRGSRVQADSKRLAPMTWGEDIVQSSRKREAALKALVQHLKISASGCWEFTGSKTAGYGSLKLPEIYGNFKILAHRLAWVAFKGENIPKGLFVCHRCDNPPCFNPDHLFLGTQEDNLNDCSAKGRTMTGSLNGNSKYTEEQMDTVLDLLRRGYRGTAISEATGISRTHVSRIKRGYTWKHLTATAADMVNGNRKYSDEQVEAAAKILSSSTLSAKEIGGITGVSEAIVKDMRRGRVHQRFMERVAE